MKEKMLRAAIALVLASAIGSAAATPNATLPAASQAERIVGLWSNLAEVRPCGTDFPFDQVAQTLLFHSGGTVSDNPLFPPGGADIEGGHYERNQGMGTWEYNPQTRRYWIHIQFDNFMDGVFVGRTTVDRQARLRNGGMELFGSVSATRYDAAGNVLGQLCGSAVATRL